MILLEALLFTAAWGLQLFLGLVLMVCATSKSKKWWAGFPSGFALATWILAVAIFNATLMHT